MTTMFRLNLSSCLFSQDRIEEFEVDQQTQHFVRVAGDKRKQSRIGEYHEWHASRQQAAEHWLNRCHAKESNAFKKLNEAKEETRKAEQLCKECNL